MKLNDFLQQIDFLHGYGQNPDVIISINGRAVDVIGVERYLNDDPIVIIPKHRATEQEGEWLEPGKCSHNWFRPDDTDNLKWGEYRLCRACHAIGIPATEQEGE